MILSLLDFYFNGPCHWATLMWSNDLLCWLYFGVGLLMFGLLAVVGFVLLFFTASGLDWLYPVAFVVLTMLSFIVASLAYYSFWSCLALFVLWLCLFFGLVWSLTLFGL